MVLVEGKDAKDLMDLVNKNEEAKVHIEVKVEPNGWVSAKAPMMKTVVA